MLKNHAKTNGFHRFFNVLTTIWGHLGAKLAQLGVDLNQLEPTWGQLVPTWPQENILWVHFGRNLPTWAPKWLQDGGPRGVREPTFWMSCWLLGPKWAKMAPRAHQEATRDPKRPPRAPKTTIFYGFGDLFWWCFLLFLFIDFLVILNTQTTYNSVIM